MTGLGQMWGQHQQERTPGAATRHRDVNSKLRTHAFLWGRACPGAPNPPSVDTGAAPNKEPTLKGWGQAEAAGGSLLEGILGDLTEKHVGLALPEAGASAPKEGL